MLDVKYKDDSSKKYYLSSTKLSPLTSTRPRSSFSERLRNITLLLKSGLANTETMRMQNFSVTVCLTFVVDDSGRAA